MINIPFPLPEQQKQFNDNELLSEDELPDPPYDSLEMDDYWEDENEIDYFLDEEFYD